MKMTAPPPKQSPIITTPIKREIIVIDDDSSDGALEIGHPISTDMNAKADDSCDESGLSPTAMLLRMARKSSAKEEDEEMSHDSREDGVNEYEVDSFCCEDESSDIDCQI